MMVAGRTIQGVGSGGILTMSEIIVCDIVSIRERGMYAGIIRGVWAIASVIDPIVGGAMAQNVSWRWIFYINLPSAGVAAIALALFLKLHRPPTGTFKEQLARIDWGGGFLLIASMTAIVLAFSCGGSPGSSWTSWRAIVPLIMGFVGLLLFIAYQAFAPWLKEPMMPLSLFGNRTAVTVFLISIIHSMLLFWACYFLPVYFQIAKDASPSRSSIMMFPMATTSAAAGVLVGISITITRHYRIWHFVGFSLMAMGFGFFTLLDELSPTAEWVGFRILFGLGTGVVFTSTLPAILASLPESDVAAATGCWLFLRNFGSIWGIAIPAAVFYTYAKNAVSRISSPEVRDMMTNGGVYQRATTAFIASFNHQHFLREEIVDFYIASLKLIWLVSVVFAAIGFVMALLVPTVELGDQLNTEYGLAEGGRRVLVAMYRLGTEDEIVLRLVYFNSQMLSLKYRFGFKKI
ncbi:hypothetical protein VHEMI00842 [[Torrubiella] hemipterigena]|uniref:Major facilitator superfamily (MFS) profile domain-containing protein n=1 Tax=[Torrubiella] hemipterigena TaxID=1531966 RepID=A0A0A1SRK4_9HYPO|nr:hypothetical protein VHEMI00842 [[Torrubiella] hemipterigena]